MLQLLFQKLKDYVSERTTDNTFFVIPNVPIDFTSNFLKNLDVHKSTGFDGISAKLLKLVYNEVAPSLTYIMNISLKAGEFPAQWKTAKVTALHKNGSTADVENYRPISVLPVLSKILEKHVHNTLYQYLTDHDLLVTSQSGFRHKHSCETALLNIVNSWTKNIDDGLCTGVVFLDFKKAFDLVDHSVLLQKLSLYKINQNSLLWFKSYLDNRTQLVSISGHMSTTCKITHGVPQGSILGPLMFLVFINDLPLTIRCDTDMYADDSTLSATGRSLDDINSKLQSDLDNVHSWCVENKMIINAKKTKCMCIASKQKQRRNILTLDLTLCDESLEQVVRDKLLGVIIDNSLTWSDHILSILGKIRQKLGLLRRISQYIPMEGKLNFFRHVFSHILCIAALCGQDAQEI